MEVIVLTAPLQCSKKRCTVKKKEKRGHAINFEYD
jgi:hypothetical protein